jgi:Chaperone of endosialidase
MKNQSTLALNIVLVTLWLVTHSSIARAQSLELSAKSDALHQLDLNRATTVDKIVDAWKSEVPAAQISSFRHKIERLRADQLFAASVSGSFDGVLEIVHRNERLQSAFTPDNVASSPAHPNPDAAKAVGDLVQDLVYTPISPCRLVDTRGAFSPVFSGGAYAPGETRTYQATGNCAIPSGAQGIVMQIIMITPNAAGDIELQPQGGAFGSTVAMVFQANSYSSVSSLAKLNASNGQFSAQIRGPGGHVAIDVTGFFISPARSGDGLRVSAPIIDFGQSSTVNVVNGSFANKVGAGVIGATISGGGRSPSGFQQYDYNSIGSNYGTIGDGSANGIDVSAAYATISGGSRNAVRAVGGTIAGGGGNIVAGAQGAIGGGARNSVNGAAGYIGGGENNTVYGLATTVVGGAGNVVDGDASFIGGGSGNIVRSATSVVIGGGSNSARADFSTVSGGYLNSTYGSYAAIPGGYENSAAGDFSFAGGQGAHSSARGSSEVHHGSFVWSDSAFRGGGTAEQFHSTTSNQFAVRARGGVAFRVVDTYDADAGAGCSLPAGGAASWVCSSDRNLKESIQSISPQIMLSKVLALPVTSWQFIGTNRRHIGPMAQDFREAFGLGADDKHIAASDVSGVALSAIKGLHEKIIIENRNKDAKIAAQARELADIKNQLAAMKKKLGM